MKGMQGIKMSYRLQMILQADPTTPVRGYRTETNGNGQTSIIALNNFIYSLIRVNRNQRRAVLASLLNMYEDTSVSGSLWFLSIIYVIDWSGYVRQPLKIW